MFKEPKSVEEKAETKKRPRVPFGGHRKQLQPDDVDFRELTEAGYTCRWVNDKDGRVQQAQAGGYNFVSPDEVPSIGQFALVKGSTDLNGKVSLIVSKGLDNPIRAFLMKIQSELYKGDQITKEVKNQLADQALNAGKPGGNVVDNQYVPDGHINKV